jgi:uncharacterized protein YbcC (UPF0753/DUF2309 family)
MMRKSKIDFEASTAIQCILRHENVSTTQRFYIETAPEVAKDAMRRLEEKIGAASTGKRESRCSQLHIAAREHRNRMGDK